MTTPRNTLTQALVEHGFCLPAGVPGVQGRTERFESIVAGFDSLIVEIARESGAERVAFPPVLDREVIRRTGYMASFPELCGSIHHYRQNRGRHIDLIDRIDQGGDWSEYLEQAPLTLCPAACYPLYPTLTGRLPEGGRLFDLTSYVFRAEPSDDPARLQAFRMRENVRIGRPSIVRDWRNAWSQHAHSLLCELGLDASLAVASDPFFGRGGKLLSQNQLAEELKFEILVPITSTEEPTAVASFNYHEDRFARAFAIETADEAPAHTACMGFGLERVVLALIESHGMTVSAWPASVRSKLSL